MSIVLLIYHTSKCMPIVRVDWTGKQSKDIKDNFYNFVADVINKETGTKKQLIYVYVTEWERENVRNTAPIVLIDWTDQPKTRTSISKKNIMVSLTEKLAEITGEDKQQIVIIFHEIPLSSASVGGITREESLQ